MINRLLVLSCVLLLSCQYVKAQVSYSFGAGVGGTISFPIVDEDLWGSYYAYSLSAMPRVNFLEFGEKMSLSAAIRPAFTPFIDNSFTSLGFSFHVPVTCDINIGRGFRPYGHSRIGAYAGLGYGFLRIQDFDQWGSTYDELNHQSGHGPTAVVGLRYSRSDIYCAYTHNISSNGSNGLTVTYGKTIELY